MEICRATFGERTCEIVLDRTRAGPRLVVAWALGIRSDGKLEPLYGERGEILREYADSSSDALAAIRRRLIALFGEERL